jgi:chromosome segregation ATPase
MNLCWRASRASYEREVTLMGNHLLRYLVVGLLLGLLMMPAPPVQAQFTVWDPTNYFLQVEKKIEEANRWLETIRHYATMVDKTVQQLTTMQGVLRNVDEQLARNVRLVRFVSSVGQIVRGSYQLKRQLEGMIRYRIAMLKSIDDRLRNGIFDPEQDLNDLENYLKFTIGRSADETVARLDKLARNDSQLESWCVRRTQIQKDLAVARTTLNQAEEQLEAERNKPDVDQSNVAHLNDVILQQQKLIAELEKEHADLQDKITERAAKYGLRLQDMENFAFSIMTVNDGWLTLQQTKDQIEQTLTDLIIDAQPRPHP